MESNPMVRARFSRWAAWTAVGATITLIGLGLGLTAAFVPREANLLGVQWAVSQSPIVVHHTHEARVGLTWDMAALIPGYSFGLALACYLGRRVFWTRLLNQTAAIGIAASFAAGLLNYTQDVLMWVGVGEAIPNRSLFQVIEGLSFAKFAMILVAGIFGVCGLATTIGRLLEAYIVREKWQDAIAAIRQKDFAAGIPEVDSKPLVIPPPEIELDLPEWHRDIRPFAVTEALHQLWPPCASNAENGEAGAKSEGHEVVSTHWDQGYGVPGEALGGVAICPSGGGHRSATVTLGALQGLREQGKLLGTDHLIGVSGGGYMVGGFQLALTETGGVNAGDTGGATAGDVFASGSAEEDYLRRHSSYLADGFSQWVVALGVVFRSVAGAILLIGLTIVMLGLAIGRFYHHIPIVTGGLDPLKPLFLASSLHRVPAFPVPPLSVSLAIAAPVAAATLILLWQLTRASVEGRASRVLTRIAKTLIGASLVMAVLGVIFPTIIWVSAAITRPLGLTPGTAAYAGGLNLILAYLSALIALGRRNSGAVSKGATAVTSVFNRKLANTVMPRSMAQMFLIWILLIVASVVSLLLAGWVATSGLDDSWWALLPVGAFLFCAIFLDQTWLSLHPFYRQRLTSGYAVRRRSHSHRGIAVAEPYDFEEGTPLSSYAAPRPDFPTVTFCCTANITGQDRTPAGQRAASYVLRHDYVGGPRVGWVRTDFLEALLSKQLGHDLTVEAAMAISGAAIASAMGSQTRYEEVFLALTNIRLGAWLPNPYFVALKVVHMKDWTIPGLPRIRRLSYLFREIFGIHPSTSRLLLCTDGGHYDNLGLVEALRHRCKKIYCFDATGFSQPLASTFAGALALARDELGVDITLANAYDLVPGGLNLLGPSPSFTDLNALLSRSSVITGHIRYPATDTDPPSEGYLVLAQANLTVDLPYALLEFRQEYPNFPWEGTADQLFNYAQFDAYHELGRFLGKRAGQF